MLGLGAPPFVWVKRDRDNRAATRTSSDMGIEPLNAHVSHRGTAARGPGAGCTSGKRCLVVDQLVLKGIVQMRTGNFALVENISKRPYVLHENDSLFNGSVVKITGDSVVFREESNDILGRPVSKEVVKKVSAPAV